MKLSFYIALRYLFAKKSHNAINIISMISVCSVAIATIALVCVLSVFNGFKELVASMFVNFDPELKIIPATGKVFDPGTESVRNALAMPEIAQSAETLQDNVLVRYNGQQVIALAKGVSESFREMAHIDSLVIDGRFVLQEGETSYASLGIGLASSLGVNAGFVYPMEIYAPKRDEKINLSNPATAFQLEYAFIGSVFSVNQPVYDENTMILPVQLVRNLLHYDKEVSAIELKLHPQANVNAARKRIQAALGDGFKVQDRYEQQEVGYKMMQVEKWVTFLILVFILTIALFNVVSSLSMLMIEKQNDVQMLRSMGADDRLIRRIFLFEGCMIPALGALVGVVIGLILCLLQQYFGLLKLGDTAGMFMSDDYPVRVVFSDILVIFATVLGIGALASWYPVRYLGKKWLKKERMILLLLPCLLWSCAGNQSQERSVAVTIAPQRYFAGKIAGDQFDIHVVVPSGQSPETYDPAPHEMIRLARSRAYFMIGRIGFEQAYIGTIRKNNPHLQIFDLSEGVKWLGGEHASRVHSSTHSHQATDPHIWCSTGIARIIAQNTLKAFISLDSEHESVYMDNYQELIGEIDRTEKSLHAMLDTLTVRTFIIYHPTLTYFADEFQLSQLAIENDGKEPSAASMKELIDEAKKDCVRVVFIQEEFDRKHAEQLAAEIGARTVTIQPLDSAWDKQMLQIANELITVK